MSLVAESPSQSSFRIAITICVIALAVRGLVCFGSVDQYAQDPDAYQAIAETIANQGVFGITRVNGEADPTAYRPPLYPYLLSWLTKLGPYVAYGIAALHTILGVLTVLCTYRASRRLLNEVHESRGSILAAALVIVDPVLLQQSRWTMTETLATFLASAIIWWWVRWSEMSNKIETAFVLGALLALAYLCRPTFLVWGAMLCVGTAMAKPYLPTDPFMRLGRATLVTVVLCAAVGYWTIRNQRQVGHPVWATTHGGYTLLLGNNPMFYDYLKNGESGSTWDANRFFLAYSHRYDGDSETADFWSRDWQEVGKIPPEITEHEDDQVSYQAAVATIARQPGMFVWASLIRVVRLWSPLPHRTGQRTSVMTMGIGLFYLCLWVAVVVGVWKLGRLLWAAKWWPILTLVFTLTAVHAIYWSNIRMRAPAMPGLAILAGALIRKEEESGN